MKTTLTLLTLLCAPVLQGQLLDPLSDDSQPRSVDVATRVDRRDDRTDDVAERRMEVQTVRRDLDPEDFLVEGDWELSLSVLGSWAEQDRPDVERVNIGGEVALGYLVTEWFEPGIKAEYLHQNTDFEGTDTETNSVIGAGTLTFNLPTHTRFVPFVTGSGGIVYTDSQVDHDLVAHDTGAFWEAGGGLRIFISSWAALNLKVTFQQFLLEDEGDVNAIVGTAGLSIFFGGPTRVRTEAIGVSDPYRTTTYPTTEPGLQGERVGELESQRRGTGDLR